jgi:hypothetical protein
MNDLLEAFSKRRLATRWDFLNQAPFENQIYNPSFFNALIDIMSQLFDLPLKLQVGERMAILNWYLV